MLFLQRPNSPLEIKDEAEFTALASDASNLLWLELEADQTLLRQKLESLNLLHPLSVERLETEQPRAFLDEHDDYLHILLLEIHYNIENEVEPVACHFIIGCNYLITFHTEPVLAISSVLRGNPPARYFSRGSDVLFYHIAEPLISLSFSVLDSIAELTEDVEDRIFPKPDRQLLNELFSLKKDLIGIRKSLAPMREVFSLLSRRENPFVDEEALPYMSHLYDLLIRVHEISDTQREIVAGALEIYLSSVSNRMNEVMMFLTMVSTIILPPTLIVGYYGMNFRNFPELGWPVGAFFVLFLIIGSTVGMLCYFKKRNWF